jgi:hypothetical protein
MVARTPLSQLVLQARSVADDLGYVALADLSAVLAEVGVADSRLIGGHMVTLHVYRWGLGQDLVRETRDADLGIPLMAARDPAIVDRLIKRGYKRDAGNRYVRKLTDIPVELGEEGDEGMEAAIDILVPAYTSRAKDNVRVGDHLTTTEVPGLADALRRPAAPVSLRLGRLNGDDLEAEITLPDEASALILKALAWETRGAPRDAVDLWRMLEVAVTAGVGGVGFAGGQGPRAVRIVRAAFTDRNGLAIRYLATERRLSQEAAGRLHTRLQALAKRVLGEPAES